MSERATTWSLTINNPTASDEEAINLARQKGWKVYGQEEVGQEGTPHYQLMVKTPQVRFSAVKKLFPRGHIEVARDPAALARYVVKEATRVSSLPAQQDKYPSLSKYWALVFGVLNDGTKDGLDYVELAESRVAFYREHTQRLWETKPLALLDRATKALIKEGYHVEGIAANPTTRSQWNLYADEILLRCYAEMKNVDDEHNHADATNWPAEIDGLILQEATCDAQSAEASDEQTSSEGSTCDS